MNDTMMGTGSQEPAPPPLTSLMGDIVEDVQKLIEKHLDLFHREIQDDISRTQSALMPIALAGGLAVSASCLIAGMLVGLLAWAVPEIPWWGWCGILGVILGFASLLLYVTGRAKLTEFNPLPDESLQAVKESIQCISNPNNTMATAPTSGRQFAPR